MARSKHLKDPLDFGRSKRFQRQPIYSRWFKKRNMSTNPLLGGVMRRLTRNDTRIAGDRALAVGTNPTVAPQDTQQNVGAEYVEVATEREMTVYLDQVFPLSKYSGDYTNLNQDTGAMLAMARGYLK